MHDAKQAGQSCHSDQRNSMDIIFQQLGNLLLGALPTAILFIVLVTAYQVLVQGPLTATLQARRARTEGAVEEAHKAIALAEAQTAAYAEKLRQARAAVFRSREQRVKQWNAERDAALEAARAAAQARVRAARSELEAEAETARGAIEASAADLAKQVVRAVLPQAAGGTR